jgi:tetratricopeptide (TPR) repeat protein
MSGAAGLTRGTISVQAAKVAIFMSLAMATALGAWYLRVRIPESQWRRPHEAGRESMSRGRFGEAEREFATAAELAKALGENDPREALSLFHQADALVAQNRFDDAIPLFERALAIDEKALGPDHPDVAPVLEHYAVPLRRTGRIAQAEAAEDRGRIIRGRSLRGKRRASDRRAQGETEPRSEAIGGG